MALLIVGLIMPAGTLAVAATDWPLALKTVLSSILLFGFEIMIIPAVALMGNRRVHQDTARHSRTRNPCFVPAASAYLAHCPGLSWTQPDTRRHAIL